MELIKGKMYHFKSTAEPEEKGKYGEYVEEIRGFYVFKVKRMKTILFVKKEELELL